MGKYFKEPDYIVRQGHFKDSKRVIVAESLFAKLVKPLEYLGNWLRYDRRWAPFKYNIRVSPRIIKPLEDAFIAYRAKHIPSVQDLKKDLDELIKYRTEAYKPYLEDLPLAEKRIKELETKITSRPDNKKTPEWETELALTKSRVDNLKRKMNLDTNFQTDTQNLAELERRFSELKDTMSRGLDDIVSAFNKDNPKLTPSTWNGDPLKPEIFIGGTGVATNLRAFNSPIGRAFKDTFERQKPDSAGNNIFVKAIEFLANKVKGPDITKIIGADKLDRKWSFIPKGGGEPVKLTIKEVIIKQRTSNGNITNDKGQTLIPQEADFIKEYKYVLDEIAKMDPVWRAAIRAAKDTLVFSLVVGAAIPVAKNVIPTLRNAIPPLPAGAPSVLGLNQRTPPLNPNAEGDARRQRLNSSEQRKVDDIAREFGRL